MPPADRTARERLGRLLAERRAQISPRYANRRAFAADREMNWRTLYDIEAARRDNFRPETMRAFEAAYMLAPGSLGRTLAGGELEPLPPASPAPEAAPVSYDDEPQGDAAWALFPHDRTKRLIWRVPASEDERAAMIEALDRKRRESAVILAGERERDEAG